MCFQLGVSSLTLIRPRQLRLHLRCQQVLILSEQNYDSEYLSLSNFCLPSSDKESGETLSWTDPRTPEPMLGKVGCSSSRLFNQTESYPSHIEGIPHGAPCVSATELSCTVKAAANILAWLLTRILTSLPFSTFWWILFYKLTFFTDPLWFITPFFSLQVLPIAFNRNWIPLNVAFLSV